MVGKPIAVILTTALAVALLLTVVMTSAQAHLAYHPRCSSLECRARAQERNLAHARYVCYNGAGRHKRWACHARRWLSRELARTRARIDPFPYGAWDRLAICESGRNPPNWAHGTATGYQGGLGFAATTWDAYKLPGYPPEAYQATRAQQIRVGLRLVAINGGRWSPSWGCARTVGLP